jgi:subtilisin family serine protease
MEDAMKLRFGKSGWIDLVHLPLASHVERNVRVFESASPESARAGVIANSVVARNFEKTVPAFASDAQRAEAAADKVDTAAFTDETGLLRYVYREVVIRFETQTAAAARQKLLDKFKLLLRPDQPFSGGQVIAYDPKRKYIAERMIELANDLTETAEVAFAFPNFVSEFRREAAPVPAAEQWHLGAVSAAEAWKYSLGNKVTVAVLDDGVDIDHPNLKANIRRKPDPADGRDKFGRDFFVAEEAGDDHFDPRPKLFASPFDQMDGNDIHGTPCAGVIAASGKSGGFLGIAPKARILPVKIFHANQFAAESRVANAVRYAAQCAHILSCSWSGAASPDIDFAIRDAQQARGGLGAPVFCATGNNHEPKVGFPANSPHAIGVGASTDGEELASYSNTGAEVSIVAPSSGGAKGIFTTDISQHNRGFNTGSAAAGGADGLHTNSFGGTSSATPLAAGIAALMLSANPKLTRGDIKNLMESTADKIGPASAYDANGHGKQFGFGRVNAAAAVAAAIAAK